MVTINGHGYEPRGLTVREVRKLKDMDETESDVNAIAWACGLSFDVVDKWIDTVPMGVAVAAVREVFRVTQLDEGAGFPDGQGNDVGPERSGV